MTVKNVVKLCGELLQYDFERQIFEDGVDNEYIRQSMESNKNLKLLTQCVGFCEKELACDYFPLRATQSFDTNVVKITDFNKTLHEVTKVCDLNDAEVDFVVTTTEVIAKVKGGIKVEYCYRPQEKSFDDALERGNPKMDERLFAYGAIAEFMFLTGMYDEATLWDKRYKDLIQVASFANKSFKIPQRRWK